MTTENFFERISNGKSLTARIASNFWFAFACICSPGVFLEIAEPHTVISIADIELWFFPFFISSFFLYTAYDVMNFAYGRKVNLENVYYDATQDNTPVRWLSLVFDLMLCGMFCHIAISKHSRRIQARSATRFKD